MARAKKEATLTPEERLQVALVPDWDWPYKLPENWCWTKIGSISSLHRGVSYKKTDAHTERRENSCLVMRGGNICEGSIDTEADNIYVDISLVAENQIVRKNDIIIVASTGSTKVIGRAGISKMDYLDVAFGAFLLLVRPSTKVNQRYIDYFFLSDNYRNRIKKLASGININNIRGEYITETLVPLAPLAEQQRIVDRIESLFTKLDEAKEKAQTVVDSFETRKAAILHKAFTGELTAKWREERGVGMESWRKITFKDVCEKITDGTHHSPVNTKNGEYMYITAKNIKENGIDLANVTFVSKDVHEEIYSRCDVQYGDVLYIKDGATTGIATVNTIKKPFSLLSSVAVLRPDKKQILSEYMAYNLNSSKTKTMMINSMSGNAITRLTLSKIKAASITICSLDEQGEIVHLIDNLLGKEQQAKDAAEVVLERINLMKKSILARTFRGELGTNDPSEESAVELLKKVSHMPAETKSKAKRKFVPQKIEAQIKTDLERKIIMAFIQSDTVIMPIQQLMSVSSRKFDVIETLRNLQERGILLKENDTYKLMG